MYVYSLPFRFPDTLEGPVRSGGILCAEADGLVLEFQTRDGLFGVIKSGVRTVALSFDRMDEVRLQSNVFRTEAREMALRASDRV